jgi:hypothetical protein
MACVGIQSRYGGITMRGRRTAFLAGACVLALLGTAKLVQGQRPAVRAVLKGELGRDLLEASSTEASDSVEGVAPPPKPAAAKLPCVDGNGHLWKGWFIESYQCVSETVWFQGVTNSPFSPNGNQAGAPTDIFLNFGSLGASSEQAYDPDRFGLSIPGIGGKLVLELSPEFVYNEGVIPFPNTLIELGVAPGNPIVGNPCKEGVSSVVCGKWDARFGNNTHQIEIIPQDSGGLIGRRATEIGVKFVHIHPILGTSNSLYHNAKGLCNSDGKTFCLHSSDCPNNGDCMVAALSGYVTATILDRNGNIVHQATRPVPFEQESPQYTIHASNWGMTSNTELFESVSGQHVAPTSVMDHFYKPESGNFSGGGPYAARFILFGQKNDASGYPHPSVDVTGFIIANGSAEVGINSNGETIGVARLKIPAQWAEAYFVQSSDKPFQGTVDKMVGGTVFAIPFKIGDFPGEYSVEVTMNGGSKAVSRVFVDSSSPAPSTASVLTSSPSGALTSLPTKYPISTPTGTHVPRPSIGATDEPSNPVAMPTTAPMPLPSNVPGAPTTSLVPSPMPAPDAILPSEAPRSTPTSASSSDSSVTHDAKQTSVPTLGSAELTSSAPSDAPSASQIHIPVLGPSQHPSSAPILLATMGPSRGRTESPTTSPTSSPTANPTETPTTSPTKTPTSTPTETPTSTPTETPTSNPTGAPTARATKPPTQKPSSRPSPAPTPMPTTAPTFQLDSQANLARVEASRPVPINGGTIAGVVAMILVLGTLLAFVTDAARQILFHDELRPDDALFHSIPSEST